MNRDILAEIFKRNDVPKRYYSFDGGGIGDCLALERLDGQWILSYYTDRGGDDREATFGTEAEGCEAMFTEISSLIQNTQNRTIRKDA